jgi:hypothetical protein
MIPRQNATVEGSKSCSSRSQISRDAKTLQELCQRVFGYHYSEKVRDLHHINLCTCENAAEKQQSFHRTPPTLCASRGFAAAQIVVSSTIQTDLVNQLSQIKAKVFLNSPKAPKTLSVAKGRSCKLRILEGVQGADPITGERGMLPTGLERRTTKG